MKILINNGNVFKGNEKQFENCFLIPATKEQIINWCNQNNFTYEFLNDDPYRDKEIEKDNQGELNSKKSDIFESIVDICIEFNKNIDTLLMII